MFYLNIFPEGGTFVYAFFWRKQTSIYHVWERTCVCVSVCISGTTRCCNYCCRKCHEDRIVLYTYIHTYTRTSNWKKQIFRWMLAPWHWKMFIYSLVIGETVRMKNVGHLYATAAKIVLTGTFYTQILTFSRVPDKLVS